MRTNIMIIVPIMLRMYGMGIYGPGWPSTINNSALTSIILHIMSIFTITGSYKYSCTSVWNDFCQSFLEG